MEPSVLDALEPAERVRLLDRAVTRRLSRGQNLYLAGETAGRAHILVEGIVKMLARSGEGHATILCLGLPGELLGDVGLLDRGPQPFDVVAATPVCVLGVDSDALREVLCANPRAALEAAGSLARRLRWVCDAALERSAGNVRARLAGRLLELADLLGHMRRGTIELEMPFPQEDLARLAGMCRESACKTLRGFQRQGLLDYRGRRLRILRPDALHKIRFESVSAPSDAASARR